MDRFPRGSHPDLAKLAPPQPAAQRAVEHARRAGESPKSHCDLAMTCPTYATIMQPEHAHYRCLTCGYRDSCCF